MSREYVEVRSLGEVKLMIEQGWRLEYECSKQALCLYGAPELWQRVYILSRPIGGDEVRRTALRGDPRR